MALSSWDGEHWTPHLILEDDECGEFGGGPEGPDLERQVAVHFHLHHPDVRVIVEGRHFRRREAPIRCDVCGLPAEMPWWDHVAEPKIDMDDVLEDSDGHWVVCDPCHERIIERDLPGLVHRIWGGLAIISPVTVRPGPGTVELRAVMAEKARTILRSFDAGSRVEL